MGCYVGVRTMFILIQQMIKIFVSKHPVINFPSSDPVWDNIAGGGSFFSA